MALNQGCPNCSVLQSLALTLIKNTPEANQALNRHTRNFQAGVELNSAGQWPMFGHPCNK